jgi:hypothetical protein
MAGAGLAISLAYLALERFRYRRDVEAVALKLHEKYENDARLGTDQTLEHLQELKWLCRKDCNGHVPNGVRAWVYRIFFRRHGDVGLISFLAAVAAAVLVQGVSGQAGITIRDVWDWVLNSAFLACFAAMAIPGAAVLAGRWCRAWAVARAHKCDDQIAHALKLSAQEAKAPALLDESNPASSRPIPLRPTVDEARRSYIVRDPVTRKMRARRSDDPPDLT